jgi:hypothetical protein
MGMWRGICEMKTLTQSHQIEILKKISKTRSVFQISRWRGSWRPLRKKNSVTKLSATNKKISGRKSLDWMLLSNRFVRTAEGGVNTGGGMDMTKYLSGSYYRLYTLQMSEVGSNEWVRVRLKCMNVRWLVQQSKKIYKNKQNKIRLNWQITRESGWGGLPHAATQDSVRYSVTKASENGEFHFIFFSFFHRWVLREREREREIERGNIFVWVWATQKWII